MLHMFKHIPSGELCDVEDGVAMLTFSTTAEAQAWLAVSMLPEHMGNYALVPVPEGMKAMPKAEFSTRLVRWSLGIHSAHVSRKANEYGEFVTKYYTAGKHLKDADDFQDTYEDATQTAIANLNFMNKD